MTAAEDFFNAEVAGRLRPGEKVLHATYLAQNDFGFVLANGRYAAITDQRDRVGRRAGGVAQTDPAAPRIHSLPVF